MGDIDALPLSLDSLTYNADSISSTLGLFGDDFKLGYFSGSNMEATFEVERLGLFPPMRQYVSGFWPITDATAVEIAVAPRESINSSESFGAYATQEDSGFVPADSSARMHDVRTKIPAGETWTHARGLFVDAIEDGEL